MITDLIRDNVKPHTYRTLFALLGEPAEMDALRQQVAEARASLAELTADRDTRAEQLQQTEQQLETTRQERLEWRAKEANTRKDLQDAQERNKDLLEQVVQLTHQKRASAKDLLDQKFKTEATPLERTRFEMELTEARGKVRRAEERVKEAEAKLAHCQTERKSLARKAQHAKQLEADLAWARRQAAAHLQALGAAIAKLRLMEGQLDSLAATSMRRAYAKPDIRAASAAVAESFAVTAPA